MFLPFLFTLSLYFLVCSFFAISLSAPSLFFFLYVSSLPFPSLYFYLNIFVLSFTRTFPIIPIFVLFNSVSFFSPFTTLMYFLPRPYLPRFPFLTPHTPGSLTVLSPRNLTSLALSGDLHCILPWLVILTSVPTPLQFLLLLLYSFYSYSSTGPTPTSLQFLLLLLYISYSYSSTVPSHTLYSSYSYSSAVPTPTPL